MCFSIWISHYVFINLWYLFSYSTFLFPNSGQTSEVWKDRQFILFVQSLLWKYQASSLEILRKTSTCVLFRNNRRYPRALTPFLESRHGILHSMLLNIDVYVYNLYLYMFALITHTYECLYILHWHSRWIKNSHRYISIYII